MNILSFVNKKDSAFSGTMDRRVFLKYIPYFGILFFKIQDVFSHALKAIFSPNADTKLTIKPEGKSVVTIPILWKHQLAHIPAIKIAESLGYHTYFNDTKKKIVLYLPQNQVVITAENAFVIIDDKAFQIPAPALWENGKIFVPVKFLIPLLNRRTHLHWVYNPEQQTIRISQQNINITDATVTEKKNGTLIRIHTLENFESQEITADIRYGWLHVDFYGGKVDTNIKNRFQPGGLINQIKIFQFPELASLAFKIKSKPLSQEIITKPARNEVLVVLRTQDELSDEEIAELREEDTHEPSDELKRQLEEERKKWLIDKIVIDAGHGGKDPGAIGIDKTYEKDIVLAIAKKLGKIIKKELPEVEVVFTRSTDKFIPLRQRTEIANQNNGKVFVSIHANSNKRKRVSGFETYILGAEKGEMARDVVLKENSVISFEDASSREEYKGINQILATMAQNAFSRQSEYLASLVQQEMNRELRSLKLPNRGVKQGPFWVMVGATMPNILVETGFLSNPYDVKILKTSAYQYKIAEGIFNGLKRFKRDYENAI